MLVPSTEEQAEIKNIWNVKELNAEWSQV